MKRIFLIFSCLILGAICTYIGQSVLQGQVPAVIVPREFASYRDIVKRVLPAVVSVDAQGKGRGAIGRQGDMQVPRGDDDNRDRIGFGSGFIISPKGVVVTNNHVVAEADSAIVQLSNGKKYSSKKIYTDPKTDLAIIVLDTKDVLPHLDFGDSTEMEIGDRVLAVGAPFGLTGTVTHGIISSKGRSLRMNMYEDFLQTDAAINPGNSGGPLVSLEGKVIGINSAIKSRSGGFQGIGLAISSNLGKSIAEKLLRDGVVRRGYLGVGIRDMDEELAKELGLSSSTGVLITRVYPDAPGDKAGLQKGDVLFKIGGKAIRDGKDLQTVVADQPLGKPVDVEILREGKAKTLSVTIEEQPRTFGSLVPVPGNSAPPRA